MKITVKPALFFLISLFLAFNTSSQSLKGKYLQYRTDSYWDTILFRSELDYYYGQYKGRLTRKEYPVWFLSQVLIRAEDTAVVK